MITLDIQRPTARKEHRCDWCYTTINPGEKYVRSRHIGDDGPYSWKACLPCDSLAGTVWEWAYRPDEGISEDSFAEWANEHRDDPEYGPAAVSYCQRRDAAKEATKHE